jgi:hypothetical protein
MRNLQDREADRGVDFLPLPVAVDERHLGH